MRIKKPSINVQLLDELNKKENRGLGMLDVLAKQDSPEEYALIKNRGVFEEIEECNGTHNATAEIASKLLKGQYVCAFPQPCKPLWFRFNGTSWEMDKDKTEIRKELSTFVKDQFTLTANIISRMNPDDTKKIKDIMKIAKRLEENTRFRNNVLYEMTEYICIS